MKQHRDLYSLDENDMREEIKERNRQYENREEWRKRLVRDIALQENAPIACIEDQACTVNTFVDGENLEEGMLQDNQKYIDTKYPAG